MLYKVFFRVIVVVGPHLIKIVDQYPKVTFEQLSLFFIEEGDFKDIDIVVTDKRLQAVIYI